ncbi:thiamine-phosphate kinase [Erythrobacter sp. SD-21]|uniref:thiamine-phosphate kinase n=1 Tax=Erythrobacter sp. SD-21 TaxID=161528 RepID=UPI000153F2A0|nr:thiamine-phosphate kinase [Erythrobacter sp. SD-21]EDL48966.1 thiamine-monophosphate kinase [Erythrobacter sp. SD-21]
MRALATTPGARGLEDDAAILELGGETLVLTHDTMVDGVHVLEGQDPADIAWKLVAVNLSDLAAKGAEPVGVLLSHMLGTDDHRFVTGLREVLDCYDVPLLGGDTVRGEGPRVWGCTAIGRATHRPVPSRDGAKVGDAIHVTGTLGAAMLGFEALRDGDEADSSAYRRPRPRLDEGRLLAPHVTAMMDISDGLLLDCWRMASASESVTFDLESAAIPVADNSRRSECLRWGDDYQLLFTTPAEAKLPVSATRIGTVTDAKSAPLQLDGEPLSLDEGLGYQH